MAVLNSSTSKSIRDLVANPLPNENIDPKIKATNEYGLKVAKAIYYRSKYSYMTFDSDKMRIKENRRYGEGLQTINKYKPQQPDQGDGSKDNLDWSADSITAKYVDVILGDLIDKDYEMVCEAVDEFSYTEKDKVRRKYMAYMMLRDFDKEMKKVTGINTIPEGEYVPENKEELDLWISMNLKLSWEIAMEQMIDHVFNLNNWDDINRRVARDMIENKMGAVRCYYDENNHIRLRYGDIDCITTPVTTYPDFRDVKYQAEDRRMSIDEIRLLSNGDLTEQELFFIAKNYAGKDVKNNWPYGNTYLTRDFENGNYQYDNYLIDVLDFVLYTNDTIKFSNRTSKSGNEFFDFRDFDYRPKSNEQVGEKTIQVAYQGYWIVGSDYIFAYKKLKNQTRAKQSEKYSPYVLPEFIMYAPNLRDMTNKSLVERIRPHADRIQNMTNRLQHIISKIPPPGPSIDISAIQDIVMGGKKMELKDIIELFFRDGTTIYDSRDDSGERRNFKPVEINQVNIPQLADIIQVIQYEVGQIENVTGINSARDASSPGPKDLVGTQQIAYQGSLNATKEIYKGMIEIKQNVAKKIMRMIQDKVEYELGIDEFKNIISKYGLKTIELTKGLTNAEMGIRIIPILDEQDKMKLEGNIAISLQSGEISVSDAETARRMKNVKQAAQFLDVQRKKHAAERLQAENAAAQAKAAFDQESANAAAQRDAMKIELETLKEIKILEHKAILEEQAEEAKFQREMELQILKNEGAIAKTVANNQTKPQPERQSDRSQF